MKRILLLVILSLLNLGFLKAQQLGDLTGKVIDDEQTPLSGVIVRLKGTNYSMLTGFNGNFSFTNLPYKEYQIKFSFVGYTSVEKTVTILASESNMGNFVLVRNANELQEVQVYGTKIERVEQIDPEKTSILIGGKKNELLSMAAIDADISQKNARQIFAKIPGVFVYDMDGSGNQINISSRGLDPHRSWEFNVRLDNVVTNSDMYGYPASHFSMPMESVEKIQLVRGNGSLQYGAQFGGMLNYVTKKADSLRMASFESINSFGSFGLKSTYNAVGGTIGKFSYYTYFSKRVSDGFRDNAESNYESEYVKLNYRMNASLNFSGGLARSVYTYRIPGPLTESQFADNPRQSSRQRNYYSPDIFVPFFKVDNKFQHGQQLSFIVSAVLGERKSVQFTGVSGVPDEPDQQTGKWPSRQVDIDNYNSYTSELSYKRHYMLFGKTAEINTGVRLIKNNLHRRQKGTSDVLEGAMYSVTDVGFGRNLHYYTENLALFAEQKIDIKENLSINAGFRFEKGLTRMRGRIDDYEESEVPIDIAHQFPLFGLDFNYIASRNLRFYGGWSQAYRPVIFADIIPANAYELSDKNLRDAYGSNIELGMQGKVFENRLAFNVSIFGLSYKNRMGKQIITDSSNEVFVLRTNIGNSLTYGIESYLDMVLYDGSKSHWSVFSSSSFLNGKYLTGEVYDGAKNVSVDGNSLPGVPKVISRNGLTFKSRKWSSTLQYSYTSSLYSDPLNIEFMENGTVGKVPSYGVWDLNSTFEILKYLDVRLSLSNLANKIYYTKRPSGYPGPGIWTSDGRSGVLCLQLKL